MSKNISTIPAVDEYEKRRARGLAAVEEAISRDATTEPTPIVDKPVAKKQVEVNSPELVDKIDPNVVKTPQEVVKDAKDAQAFSDYVNSIYSQSDYEADEKRKKAAKWITAAQMLGDSIAALGNSYFTSKGANAMKVEPGALKAAAATSQLEQDIRNAREKAAKARYDATLKKYEMEMQREREKKSDERYEATQAENKRRYDNDTAYRRERDAIVDAREKELMEFRRQQGNRIAKSSRGASTSTKDVEPIEFTLGDGETIGIDKFNKDKLNILYRSLPDDVRYAIENEEVYSNTGLSMGTRKRKVTDDDRLQAIYDNLDNPEVANAIRRLAGVEAAAANTEAPKSAVVKDVHGNEHSVNPDSPVLGAPSSMQTDEAKKHINGIVISTGKEDPYK